MSKIKVGATYQCIVDFSTITNVHHGALVEIYAITPTDIFYFEVNAPDTIFSCSLDKFNLHFFLISAPALPIPIDPNSVTAQTTGQVGTVVTTSQVQASGGGQGGQGYVFSWGSPLSSIHIKSGQIWRCKKSYGLFQPNEKVTVENVPDLDGVLSVLDADNNRFWIAELELKDSFEILEDEKGQPAPQIEAYSGQNLTWDPYADYNDKYSTDW